MAVGLRSPRCVALAAAMGLAWSMLVTAPSARGHVDATAVGGEPIVAAASKQTMIATRRRFFGTANVDPRTGAVRRNRVILSWFGVTNFAMAIDGRVVLLDAWVPRGAHSGYVPTSPQELAALRPEAILIGHAHFDHAADAVPIAAATGARLVGTAEHCSDLRRRAPVMPPPCREVIPRGAPPGTTSRVKLAGLRTKVMKHLHSAVTGPDGYHLPVLPLPAPTTILNPPTPEDMRHLFGHLPDDEGGALLYRFRVGKFTLAWHDSSGPLIDRSPGTLAALRRLGPVDVQVGAIQGFNQITNGMRDPRMYVEALRPGILVPTHHDDWAAGITTRGERYAPFLDAELRKIPLTRRPNVRFIRDPQDYVRPEALEFSLRR